MQTPTRLSFTYVLAFMLCTLTAWAQEMPAEYQEALKTLGKTGDYKAGVLKVNIPRNDLKVTVEGVSTPTPFGFGGWLGLTKGAGGMEVMMGDLVLLQEEVNPVMSALLDNGLEVTALHNHFFWERPRVFFMHVGGHGKAADLARMAKPAVDLIGHAPRREGAGSQSGSGRTPAGQAGQAGLETGAPKNGAGAPKEPAKPSGSPLDAAKIAKIVGHEGEQLGAVYKITVGRDDVTLKEMDATINARMGLNTWAAFVGTEENAAVAGDVAMLENELTAVLKALRKNGLEVVALHHHMIGARPMFIFLHYWGQGPAEKLATGFKAALDELGKGRSAAKTRRF